MNFAILACLAAIAVASPVYDSRDVSAEHIAILRDDRVHEDGHYSTDVETANGIKMSEAGQPTGSDEAVVAAGEYSFTFPNGELFSLKYVADENGFQPESTFLPVAPAFPHPIPEFVLEQIAKAAREDAEAARSAPSAPRSGYGAPQ